jgi:hypothetical protein
MSVTFSDSMNTTDPNEIFTAIVYEDPYTDSEERIPDPEGYYAGQEEYGYDDEDFEKERDYDDAYEPDFDYDSQ